MQKSQETSYLRDPVGAAAFGTSRSITLEEIQLQLLKYHLVSQTARLSAWDLPKVFLSHHSSQVIT